MVSNHLLQAVLPTLIPVAAGVEGGGVVPKVVETKQALP